MTADMMRSSFHALVSATALFACAAECAARDLRRAWVDLVSLACDICYDVQTKN